MPGGHETHRKRKLLNFYKLPFFDLRHFPRWHRRASHSLKKGIGTQRTTQFWLLA